MELESPVQQGSETVRRDEGSNAATAASAACNPQNCVPGSRFEQPAQPADQIMVQNRSGIHSIN